MYLILFYIIQDKLILIKLLVLFNYIKGCLLLKLF